MEPKKKSLVKSIIPVGFREKNDLNDNKTQATIPPPDYYLGETPGTQIWGRLRLAGLETERIFDLDPQNVIIKIKCPEERLMDVAEVLELELKTRKGKSRETWCYPSSKELYLILSFDCFR